MRTYFFIFLSFFGLLLSCKNDVQQEKKEQQKPAMTQVIVHKKGTNLTAYTLKKTKNWKNYNELATFLHRFETSSPNEALNNAVELKDLVKKVKDSIDHKLFKTSSFRSRLNVLENEVLRLVDMTKIPSITANEVNNQVSKTLLIFGSVNAKINAVFAQQKMEEAIDLSNFFKLDSSEIKNRRIDLKQQ